MNNTRETKKSYSNVDHALKFKVDIHADCKKRYAELEMKINLLLERIDRLTERILILESNK